MTEPLTFSEVGTRLYDTLKEALAQAEVESAYCGGLSIGVCVDLEGKFTLGWGEGRTLIAWGGVQMSDKRGRDLELIAQHPPDYEEPKVQGIFILRRYPGSFTVVVMNPELVTSNRARCDDLASRLNDVWNTWIEEEKE